MKKILLILILIGFVFAAGCVNLDSSGDSEPDSNSQDATSHDSLIDNNMKITDYFNDGFKYYSRIDDVRCDDCDLGLKNNLFENDCDICDNVFLGEKLTVTISPTIISDVIGSCVETRTYSISELNIIEKTNDKIVAQGTGKGYVNNDCGNSYSYEIDETWIFSAEDLLDVKVNSNSEVEQINVNKWPNPVKNPQHSTNGIDVTCTSELDFNMKPFVEADGSINTKQEEITNGVRFTFGSHYEGELTVKTGCAVYNKNGGVQDKVYGKTFGVIVS